LLQSEHPFPEVVLLTVIAEWYFALNDPF